MSTYTAGFKARMIQRMAGPERTSATALAKEVGVSQNTLSRWLRQASEAQPTVPPMSKKKHPSRPKGSARRTAQDKLRLVLEASALSEEDLGAFLRREGVHQAELETWRARAMEAAEGALKAPHGKRSDNTDEQRKIAKARNFFDFYGGQGEWPAATNQLAPGEQGGSVTARLKGPADE